ncbi:pilus assembly protein CpaC [Rhizobium mongolense subsp. loessense]|uniref:Pilus assembly protein CpaC n=1 Tax=Rhizobium mongolense subsp. loessense TaxID=158890 RepID=A0A1G4U7I0_9HYPH|nr:type II and III secretion system protein family protein [Rhizobium mongolense]SCW88915.1 pilus assembly protein CpaC [Rhizobium mongolense subsp. loessense]
MRFPGLGFAFSIALTCAMPTIGLGAAETIVEIKNVGVSESKVIRLGLNKALVVELPEDAHDLLIADPTIADAVTRTSRRIFLFGKKVGQTNILIFGAGGRKLVDLDVQTERDVSGLEANLRRFIQDSRIDVEIVSDNIVLSGTVRTPQDALQAVDLAKAFLKGGEATTRNQTAESAEKGSVAIYAESRQSSQIVNLLKIEGEDQVTIKVTVAEIRRDILKQVGFDHLISNSSGATLAELGASTADASTATEGGGLSALFKSSIGGYNVSSTLNALEQAKAVRTLAEPTLTAVSGQAATFSAGGEALYSDTDDDGNATQSTYEYGIQLSFKPIVLSSGRISIEISTSVSEPTTSVSGSTPTYGKRSTKTTVELPSGGSIALAGLIRDNVSQTSNGTPGLKKLPLVGTLFRQRSFERNETELVIIATAYLVRPTARNSLARPDDNFSPADDASEIFMDRVNKLYGRAASEPQRPYAGNVGFIYK